MAITKIPENCHVSVLARRSVRQAATALADLLLADRQAAKSATTEGVPVVRIRRSKLGTNQPGLTQAEVAMLLNLSERSVREIEKRAFRKLRAHPMLRELWQQFLAGELEESTSSLSLHEIAALFQLAHTSEESHVLRKVLRLVRT
jgi:DNA-binding XRE family transcriptional regulator